MFILSFSRYKKAWNLTFAYSLIRGTGKPFL